MGAATQTQHSPEDEGDDDNDNNDRSDHKNIAVIVTKGKVTCDLSVPRCQSVSRPTKASSSALKRWDSSKKLEWPTP
jgi:hypothetical protein